MFTGRIYRTQDLHNPMQEQCQWIIRRDGRCRWYYQSMDADSLAKVITRSYNFLDPMQCRYVILTIDAFIRTVTTFTSATVNSNKAITSLDWISKNERYFLHGDNNGLIQLHDTRDCKTLWDIQHENSRILTLICNPTESTFVCSVSDGSEGKLLLYDIKTRKLERTLPLEQNVTALCSTFNHNGQLLITGLSNGNILIHDLRRNEIIDNLNCHSSPIIDIELINDFTNICAQSEDGKLCQRSLNHSGKILWETKIKIDKNPVHGKLFTFDQSGSYMLLCTQTGGNIYKVCTLFYIRVQTCLIIYNCVI